MNAYNPEITIIPAPMSVYLSGTSLKINAPKTIAKNRRVSKTRCREWDCRKAPVKI